MFRVSLAWSDMSGRTTGRYFPHNGKLVALREAGYQQLRRLVEKVGRAKPFNTGLSESFLEVEIFKWWRASLRQETSDPLSEYLLTASEAAIKRHVVMVPLANLEIERPFIFGAALVTPIDSRLFDEFGAEAMLKQPEHAQIVRQQARKLREELGHLTAVQIEIVGEQLFAEQRALSVAFDMADFFRFMSPVATSWNVTFACFPHGCEHEPLTTLIEVSDGKLSSLSKRMRNPSSFRWKLSFEELDGHMRDGFRNCSVFFAPGKLTGFQKRVKTAIAAYSQGIGTADIRNRLIYAMSAAEHLLLRDENEPLQSSVGERMAFLIAKTPDDRRAVVSNFKKAYGLRSRQIHHLATIDDEEVLSTFFINMFLMLTSAMDNIPRYIEHTDFLDAIDRIKFS